MEESRSVAAGRQQGRRPSLMAKLFRGVSDRSGHRLLLAINYGLLLVGTLSSSILLRFYYIHGGSSRWLTTLIQSSAFPILLLPIFFSSNASSHLFSTFTPKLLLLCVSIGLLNGVNNLLISWGISYLPLSTSSLILSSQLAFTLLLSVLLVRQTITFINLNCVILLTLSAILLAVGSDSDRPDGTTKLQFFMGFFATLGASLLFALYLPLVQLVYQGLSKYKTVMEMQVIMQASATVFALVGMMAGGGVAEVRKDMRKERGGFDLGLRVYWGTVAATAVCWQMCFMGTAGLVFLTSSLNSGVCMTALLSLNVLGGVVVFGDAFGAEKAVSLVLCLWAFSSYLYGEYRSREREVEDQEECKEMVRLGSESTGDADGGEGEGQHGGSLV
ncbi:hypothetical protein J5N97_019683 [Dioscorea zingiberensis]|uniref:Probable purine permease n=1 Tax=Dioscorea zingiberensis TaxID=325984 RepID=A0A9D5CF11_9LILI|nr:hypothetical protein J5N97_019683 [Dioscorea zingiberensis]